MDISSSVSQGFDFIPSPDNLPAAKAAHLRYVSDRVPGITRKRTATGFLYRNPKGAVIEDADELGRIRALAVPPAWDDVWICVFRNGHIQATGRDARRRKQYRYHPQWRTVRDQTKFEHLILFGQALPAIRSRVEADLAKPGLPREKVLAAVVRLMQMTLARVGNPEYARQNQSFGLTTLQNRHVHVKGGEILLDFRAKHGIRHRSVVHDRKLARILKNCRDLPGSELFQYLDEQGQRHSIDSVTSMTTCAKYRAVKLARRISVRGLRPTWRRSPYPYSMKTTPPKKAPCRLSRKWRHNSAIRHPYAANVISIPRCSKAIWPAR